MKQLRLVLVPFGWDASQLQAILRDPGADSGGGKVGTGKKSGDDFFSPTFSFARFDYLSPHYLPLGLQG